MIEPNGGDPVLICRQQVDAAIPTWYVPFSTVLLIFWRLREAAD